MYRLSVGGGGGGGMCFNLTSHSRGPEQNRRPAPSPFNRHIIQRDSFIEAAVVERCCAVLKRRHPRWPGAVPASDLCAFIASILSSTLEP